MGFVAHTDSTKTVPSCTTVEACNFTTETNTETGVGNVTEAGTVTDVPEWMIITISFAAASIIALMLVCYLLCPNILAKKRKVTYVLNHHDGMALKATNER